MLRSYSVETTKDEDDVMVDNDSCESIVNFDKDFHTLQAYYLVAVTEGNDVCYMYYLVQLCTRKCLSLYDTLEWWRQKFTRLMAREFLDGCFENWADC